MSDIRYIAAGKITARKRLSQFTRAPRS
jgi:hypothetical protein